MKQAHSPTSNSAARRWLRSAALAVIVIPLVACAHEPYQARSSDNTCNRSSLLITGAQLFGIGDMDSILIEEGVIAWIGKKADAPAHDRVLDAKGSLALPGMLDSHAHLDSLAAAKHLQGDLDTATEVFPITMRQTLAGGVTTARVHLSALEDMQLMGELSGDDCFPSPRIIISGPGLLGGAPEVNAKLMRGIAGPDDGAAKIRELAARGAEWAALHRLTQFSNAELAAITDAAATHGVKLMADADDFADLERAISASIRSAEYMNRSIAEAYPSELIAAIGERTDELFIVPPVGYYLRSADYAGTTRDGLDPSVFLFVDKRIAEEMTETFDSAFEADEYISGIIAARPSFEHKFNQLKSSGATLVIGSDSGSLGQFHHDAVWREMLAWRRLGAAPVEIIDAATRNPARMFEHNDIGTLSIGARGDVLLYRGDILGGEFDRAKVEAVIKGGVIFVEGGDWTGPDTETMRDDIRRARKHEQP